MPQASDGLRAKFPGGDGEAMTVLETNFTIDNTGLIHNKVQSYEPNERELDAICYLIEEWDYGYTEDWDDFEAFCIKCQQVVTDKTKPCPVCGSALDMVDQQKRS